MMEYLPRLLENKLKEAFRHFPVVTLLGARQTGKTTMVQELFKGKMPSVVFDPVMDLENARKDPDFFLQNHPPPIFLDEVQYVPELVSAIKRHVDRENKNGLFVLSGSQNLAVLRNITESLAGRTVVLTLQPMSVKEIEGRVSRPSFLREWIDKRGEIGPRKFPESKPLPLFHRLWRGGHPRLLQIPDSVIPSYWESYFHTYIERDIRTVAQVGALHDFGRFFALLAGFTAQEVNHHQLGRELGVDRKTALAWTSIAEATYQWIQVPAFSRNLVKGIAGKSKGYFTDTGFAAYLQRISSPEALAGHPMLGRLVETFVVMEIVKEISCWPSAPKLHHYRTYDGTEVDLILERDGILYPIEIKASSNPSPRDSAGFRSLRKRYPAERYAPNLIICAVEKPGPISEHTWAVPWWGL